MYLNFFFIYTIIGFFYVITGKIKLSLYISLATTFVIGIINHFITAFRGTPLVPWDIFSINVALNVLPTFTFSISFKLLLGIIAFGLAIYVLRTSHFSSFKNSKFKITYRIVVLLGISLFIYSFYFTNLIDKFELDENWDPKEEYHNNGLIASLFKQSRNLIINVPEGYDLNSVKKLASSIDINILEKPEGFENPNIIAIMNESFAELQTVGKFNTNKEYLPFFNSLSENTVKGNLHVSIFGATTPNSEWEFLTSNTMAFVPKRTVPYQQYVLRRSYSLATILKEHGYNQLRNKKPKTILELVWKEITDPMILILLGAVLLSVILHEWVEAWVILVIVFVNTIISVAQEKKAEASIEALKSMSSPLARVYRQGEESHISSKELVARRYCNIRGWQHGSSRHKIDRVFKFKSTRGVFNRRI